MVNRERFRSGQQGITLIVVLVILIVIALLGVTAMRMSINNTHISTNSRAQAMTFEAAEAGTRQAYAQAQLAATWKPTASQPQPPITSYDVALQASGNALCDGTNPSYPACIVLTCITQNGSVVSQTSANCQSTDRLDQAGQLQTVTQTTYLGAQNMYNSSVNIQAALFQTESIGCLPESGSTCVVMTAQNGMTTPQVAASNYSDTVVVISRPILGTN